MYDMLCGNKYAPGISYRRLLSHLHSTPFIFSIPHDANRAEDGTDLRYRYSLIQGYDEVPEELDIGPCTVLEMMLALSLRCEETIMDDPRYGNRNRQWFWAMIANLGLNGMTDDRYDGYLVDEILERFLMRQYEPDGTGGLFRLRDCKYDLRKIEIWCQLMWYLNTIR
jgi:hypothetical protein